MIIAIITNEYPPYIYGGAGVHIEYLTRELANLEKKEHTIRVLCFGDQNEQSDNTIVNGVEPDFKFPSQDLRHQKLFNTLVKDLVIAGSLQAADILHFSSYAPRSMSLSVSSTWRPWLAQHQWWLQRWEEFLRWLFMLEKAIYELGYELNNRPDWVKIPLKGIQQLVLTGR